jgi:hypothetical protein
MKYTAINGNMNQRARTVNQYWALVINTEGNMIKCKTRKTAALPSSQQRRPNQTYDTLQMDFFKKQS